jgi:hypothetical protein
VCLCCVLCILASSRILQSILRRRIPHFGGGSVTVLPPLAMVPLFGGPRPRSLAAPRLPSWPLPLPPASIFTVSAYVYRRCCCENGVGFVWVCGLGFDAERGLILEPTSLPARLNQALDAPSPTKIRPIGSVFDFGRAFSRPVFFPFEI